MKVAVVLIFLTCIWGIKGEEIKQADVQSFEELDTQSWGQLLTSNENLIILTQPILESGLQLYEQVLATLEQLVDPKSNQDPEILALKFLQANFTKNREFFETNRILPGGITWFYKGNFWSSAAITPQWNPDSLNYWVNVNLVHNLKDISDSFDDHTSCPMKQDFVVVLFDENSEEKNIFSVLKLKLAIKATDSAYYKVTNSDLIKQEGGDKKSPFVKVYQCGQAEEHSFFIDIEDSYGNISNLIASKSYPTVTRISNPAMKYAFENFDVTLMVGIPEYYNTDKLFAWLEKVNNVAILWDYSEHLLGFASAGCSGEVWPTAVAVAEHGTKPLAFNENLEFNLENVQKWVDDILAGNHENFKKSKRIKQEENEKNILKEIAYNDFEDKVINAPHPVVVAFTAARQACGGYCYTATSVLEKVQQYFEHTFPDFQIKFYFYDVELNYHVRPELGLPATVIFDKGTEVAYPLPYRQKFYQVRDWINEIYSLKDPHDEL